MDEEDFEIEDILKSRKKGVNSSVKGKSAERELCKKLSAAFGESFTRSIGSGNRWGQVELPTHAKQVFSGDICCPENFLFVLESKSGYEDDIDLNNLPAGNITKLDEFLGQVTKDSGFCGRKPLLLWKRSRKGWLAFIHTNEIDLTKFEFYMIYGKWTCISLDNLLKTYSKEFFFK